MDLKSNPNLLNKFQQQFEKAKTIKSTIQRESIKNEHKSIKSIKSAKIDQKQESCFDIPSFEYSYNENVITLAANPHSEFRMELSLMKGTIKM
jgi:hypothetical protein